LTRLYESGGALAGRAVVGGRQENEEMSSDGGKVFFRRIIKFKTSQHNRPVYRKNRGSKGDQGEVGQTTRGGKQEEGRGWCRKSEGLMIREGESELVRGGKGNGRKESVGGEAGHVAAETSIKKSWSNVEGAKIVRGKREGLISYKLRGMRTGGPPRGQAGSSGRG